MKMSIMLMLRHEDDNKQRGESMPEVCLDFLSSMSHPNFYTVSFAAICCLEISRRCVNSCLPRRVIFNFVSAARALAITVDLCFLVDSWGVGGVGDGAVGIAVDNATDGAIFRPPVIVRRLRRKVPSQISY